MLSKRFFKHFFLLFLFLFGSLSLEANWVDDNLNLLSMEERDSLRHFFATLIKEDHLGHVLFFTNKPACLGGSFIEGKKSLNEKIFFKGWKVWRAKEHLFPHPDFIIHDEIIELSGEKALHIYFINKKTLLKTFSENNFSQELFVQNLELKKISCLFEVDQALRGILFGFGKESSVAFKEYENKKRPPEMQVVFCTRPKKLTVHPVSFIGDQHSEEVKALKEKYAEELDKIERIYQKRDLLKTTLKALCSTTRSPH